MPNLEMISGAVSESALLGIQGINTVSQQSTQARLQELTSAPHTPLDAPSNAALVAAIEKLSSRPVSPGATE